MSKDEEENRITDLDVQLIASKDELSLKAKGTGLFVLVAISISGIIFMGYLISMNNGSISLGTVLVFLFILASDLIKKLTKLLQ